MNIKLKRVVRTPHSEEIAILDMDTRDENDAAVNVGKLEVHYLEDQIVGTLLVWQEYAEGFNRLHPPGSSYTMDDLIEEVLSEVVSPIGVSSEYGIEIYYPSVINHSFASNYSDEDEAEYGEYSEDENEDEDEDEDEDATESAEGEELTARDDDFYRKLTHRP